MHKIVFEKMKGRDWTGRVFMQKQLSKGFFKKDFLRNFAKFSGKHLCRKNETQAQAFSCHFYKICKIAFVAEHHQTVSDYSSINSSEQRICKRNGKL